MTPRVRRVGTSFSNEKPNNACFIGLISFLALGHRSVQFWFFVVIPRYKTCVLKRLRIDIWILINTLFHPRADKLTDQYYKWTRYKRQNFTDPRIKWPKIQNLDNQFVTKIWQTVKIEIKNAASSSKVGYLWKKNVKKFLLFSVHLINKCSQYFRKYQGLPDFLE